MRTAAAVRKPVALPPILRAPLPWALVVAGDVPLLAGVPEAPALGDPLAEALEPPPIALDCREVPSSQKCSEVLTENLLGTDRTFWWQKG